MQFRLFPRGLHAEKGILTEALMKVVSNKGGAGVDGMKTLQLRCYILEHPNEISEAVRKGRSEFL